jgi:hypothetical protein
MTSDSPKELRFLCIISIVILLVQIAGLAYLRKKFDDNIVILQSSENYVTRKVESIELMLWKMHETDAKAKASSPVKAITVKVTSDEEKPEKESTDKP